MSKKKSTTEDAKEEFQKIKESLPRGWIGKILDTYYKKLTAKAAYNKGQAFENIRDGRSAPNREEMNQIKSVL